MRAQCHGFRVLGAEGFDDLGPEYTCGTHFGDFHEVVLADGPEEGKALSEGIDFQSGFDTGAQVLKAVSQRVAEFDICRSTGFLHMIAGNRDAVEFRHVFRRVFEDITDDAHRHIWRINVRVADHEFLEDIILDRTGKDLLIDALFNTGLDEECENRQNGAVHGHGDGHLVERNAGEQDVHVEHGADRNASLADVAEYTRVIGIVTAMRRQVECDRKTFLAGSQVAAVESVGFFGCGEAGVLTYRPGTEDVHG